MHNRRRAAAVHGMPAHGVCGDDHHRRRAAVRFGLHANVLMKRDARARGVATWRPKAHTWLHRMRSILSKGGHVCTAWMEIKVRASLLACPSPFHAPTTAQPQPAPHIRQHKRERVKGCKPTAGGGGGRTSTEKRGSSCCLWFITFISVDVTLCTCQAPSLAHHFQYISSIQNAGQSHSSTLSLSIPLSCTQSCTLELLS